MTVAERRKLTDVELDLRIRDRLLASGALNPEDMEGYLAGLPDLAAQADAMNVDQPALGPPMSGSRADAAVDDSEGLE
jgi:hypothetical protein